MKRFAFPLESPLRIRKIQADVENAKLARLEAERADCRRQLNLLPIEGRKRPDAIQSMQPMERNELVEIDSVAAFLKREKKRLTAREGELLHLLATARRSVQQATKRVELLETLKKDLRRNWQIEADKELQTLAEESHMHQLQSRRE